MQAPWTIDGKTALVTGGTSGIGYATAAALASRGAHVIVVGRDAARGAAAVAAMQRRTGKTHISFMRADISSLREIRQLAEQISAQYPRLHVLINNAGGTNLARMVTVDGFEATFATNYLGPFLLTNLLLPLLKASAPARIVNINSIQHRYSHINFDDLQSAHDYTPMRAYQQAKLANLLFTYELARRLSGTHILVNAADPGGTAQGVRGISATFSPVARVLVRSIALPLLSGFLTPERAAQSAIYLASSPEAAGINGKYVNSFKKVVRSSPASYDTATAEKLWHVSAILTGLESER